MTLPQAILVAFVVGCAVALIATVIYREKLKEYRHKLGDDIARRNRVEAEFKNEADKAREAASNSATQLQSHVLASQDYQKRIVELESSLSKAKAAEDETDVFYRVSDARMRAILNRMPIARLKPVATWLNNAIDKGDFKRWKNPPVAIDIADIEKKRKAKA